MFMCFLCSVVLLRFQGHSVAGDFHFAPSGKPANRILAGILPLRAISLRDA